jgi:hypothetical protein
VKLASVIFVINTAFEIDIADLDLRQDRGVLLFLIHLVLELLED